MFSSGLGKGTGMRFHAEHYLANYIQVETDGLMSVMCD